MRVAARSPQIAPSAETSAATEVASAALARSATRLPAPRATTWRSASVAWPFVFVLAIGAGVAASAPAQVVAQDTGGLRLERAMHELRRPFASMTPERWAKVGPAEAVAASLVHIYRDPSLDPPLRWRALEALAFFPSKRTTQVLWQVVYEKSVDARERAAALHALGWVLQREGLAEIGTFMMHPDPVVREGAARGLGGIRDARARSVLESHLDREPSIDVRLAIEESLAQLARWEAHVERRRARSLGVEPDDAAGDPLHGLMEW
jgi:HEAT repeat protein